MKTRAKYIGLLLLMYSVKLSAQQNFNRNYYFGEETYGMGIMPYSNHYIVGGFNMIPVADSNLSVGTYYNKTMAFVLRTDLNGDSLFFQNYSDVDSAMLAQFDFGGGMTFIHGTKGENGNSYWTGYHSTDSAVYWYQSDLYIVKLDSMGNTLWEKSYDAPMDSSYVGWTIDYNEQTGRIVTCGYLTKNTQDKQGFIIEIDTLGNLLNTWVPIDATNHLGNFNTIVTLDSIIITGGVKDIAGFNNFQPHVLCINVKGQLLWSYYLPPTSNINFVADIVAINNQELIFYWCNAIKLGSSPWVWVHHLVKMDIGGNLIWDKPVFYSYHQNGRLKYLDNGNIMFSGVFKDTLGGPMSGYLVIFDTSGTMLWDRAFVKTPGAFQWFRDGAPTADGDFIMTGETSGTYINPISQNLASDLWIVKTDSLGLITSSNQGEPPPIQSCKLSNPWPNPAREHINVETLIPAGYEAILYVFDLSGRELFQTKLEAGLQLQQISTTQLPAGTYLLALSLDGYKADAKRFVKGE